MKLNIDPALGAQQTEGHSVESSSSDSITLEEVLLWEAT